MRSHATRSQPLASRCVSGAASVDAMDYQGARYYKGEGVLYERDPGDELDLGEAPSSPIARLALDVI